MTPVRSIPFLLVLGLLAPPAARAQAAYATLAGTVIDAETGAPLPGAHVFIAASMMGTATDDAGRFRLDRVPPGAHRLYVSMLGFESAARDTLLRGDRSYTFAFHLAPKVLNVGEVTVTAERDERWKKRLRAFERLFLGESANADSTRILNPEVLDFEGGWGRLEAWAEAPLVIENRALGYRLRYFLKEFIRSGGTIKYDGEPLFEELEPESRAQAAAWTENRRRAYFGSLRHYLLALLAGRCEEEGFTTYRRFSLDHLAGTQDRFWIDPQKLLRAGPSPTEKELRFAGYVEVLYRREAEEDAYLRWRGASAWSTPANQRSWMKLTDGPTLVDHTGEVLDPYGVTVYGYFAFERIADLVPKEYRPGI